MTADEPDAGRPVAGRSRREDLLLLLAAFGAGAVVRSGIREAGLPDWLLPVDDAYIFVRFAQQAARGEWFQWTSGEPSTGATGFLFLLLLVPGQWIFGDLAGWSRWSILVGTASLGALGVAAAALVRSVRPRPAERDHWPLAAGLSIIGGGAFGQFAAGGMDNAFSAAALLAVLAACVRGRSRLALGGLALLPWVRPDLVVVSAVGGAWWASRAGAGLRGGRSRLWGAVALIPGFLLAGTNRVLTGHFSSGGVLAKSIFSDRFSDPAGVLELYLLQLRRGLAPVYLGKEPSVLPLPVAAAALAAVVWVTSGWLRRLAGAPRSPDPALALRLPVLAWAALVAVAPLSGYLTWQHHRHHHAGLALAWVLAFAAVARLADRLPVPRAGGAGRSLLRAALVIGLGALSWLGLGSVARDHAATGAHFSDTVFRAAGRVQRSVGRDEVLLVHDAGLLSLVHDGPLVDVMGLGTTDLALPYRDGPGAVVEHLARRPEPPAVAAGRPELLGLGPLLGEPLGDGAAERGRLVVAPVRRELLAATALGGPGIDFGFRPSEDAARLRWDTLAEPSHRAPRIVVIPEPGGGATAHGCRIVEALEIGSFREAGPRDGLRVVFVALPGAASGASVVARWGEGNEARADVAPGFLGELLVPTAGGVRIERRAGSPPCLESVALVDLGAGSDRDRRREPG